MELKKAFFILITVGVSCVAKAQSDAIVNQYWAMPAFYNAAAVGRDPTLNVALGAKMQWLGIENAPKTALLVADMPFNFLKRNHGIGLRVSMETAGLYNTTSASLQYAFNLKLGKGTLRIGLQPGMINAGFRGSKVDTGEKDETSNDPAIPKTDVSGSGFDIGAGLFFDIKQWHFGISGNHLTQPTVRFGENSFTVIPRNLYFMAGGNIKRANSLYEVSPSLLVRTDMSTFTAEASVRVTYKQLFWLGAGYRYNDGVLAMLGINIKELMVGYSYDYSLSPLAKVSSGSHELILRYKIKLSQNKKQNFKYKSVRIL